MNADEYPCPNCGVYVSKAAKICHECGFRLSSGGGNGRTAPEAEQHTPTADANDTVDTVVARRVRDEPDAQGPAAQPIDALKRPPADLVDSGSTQPINLRSQTARVKRRTVRPAGLTDWPEAPQAGDCADFMLLYNEARVFLAGFHSAFNFRIVPISDDAEKCRNMEILMQSEVFVSDRTVFKKKVRVTHKRKDVPLPDVHFTFRPQPEDCGLDIGAEVFLSYEKDGRRHCYYAPFLWDAYPASEEPGKIIDNLTIKLEAVADRASDSTNTLNLLNGLSREGPRRAEQLRRLKLPPVWNLLPLFEVTPSPAGPGIHSLPAPSSAPDRITVRARGGALLHLVGLSRVQFGKNRECGVITRIMDSIGEATAAMNLMISKKHHAVELREGKCFLVDGDGAKASLCGVFVDGIRIPAGPDLAGSKDRKQAGEPFELPVNRRFVLSLAGADPNDEHVLSFACSVWTCNAMGGCGTDLHQGACKPREPACLVLSRMGNIRETILILWRFCSLPLVGHGLAADFGPLTFYRYREAFAYSLTNQGKPQYSWLVPGRPVGPETGDVAAAKFRQFGKWA